MNIIEVFTGLLVGNNKRHLVAFQEILKSNFETFDSFFFFWNVPKSKRRIVFPLDLRGDAVKNSAFKDLSQKQRHGFALIRDVDFGGQT
ncbi:MAG: hypothetical protein GY854_10675 [Deltaproteobacteria bacterium]|nr:hypothetical protein [Deltaproteobacteria bacterium]